MLLATMLTVALAAASASADITVPASDPMATGPGHAADAPHLIGQPAQVRPAVAPTIGRTLIGLDEPAWLDLTSGGQLPDLLEQEARIAPLVRALRMQKPVEALADAADDEDGNPLVDFSQLSVGPTAFTMVRSGRPSGSSQQWPHVMDTALSYVRPHRNLEFVMSFHGESDGPRDQLGTGLVTAKAQLIDNMKVQVDSSKMYDASSMYGQLEEREKGRDVHPGQMIAFGFDLGLLPAVLADVGINTTITIGESTNPGPFIAVATNIEVPNEKTRELNVDTEHRVEVALTAAPSTYSGITFASGFAADDDTGGEGGGGGGGDGPTPIIPDPPVPEPSTMLLLAAGAAVIAARRRQRR